MPDRIKKLPFGVLFISLFYAFGAVVLLIAAVTNPVEMSREIAVRHGLPSDVGIAALLGVAALGFAISYGLATLSRWGWILTMAYVLYFGGVSVVLGGLDFLESSDPAQQTYFGNLVWSAIVFVYLLLKRRHFLANDLALNGGRVPLHRDLAFAAGRNAALKRGPRAGH